MGSFKKFLMEEDLISLDDIKSMLDELNDEELDILGAYIFSEFYESEEDDVDELTFTYSDILDMIEDLGEEMYPYIYDMLSIPEYDDEDDVEDDDKDMDESVNRVMLSKNVNRKKRKFMKKSLAQLRKEAPQRKIANRKTFTKRRRYARTNAAKISQYKQSRSKFIKKGVHHTKLRKKSGLSA